jgi:hypothetical protein
MQGHPSLLHLDVSIEDTGGNLSAKADNFSKIAHPRAIQKLDLGAHMQPQGLGDVTRLNLGQENDVAISGRRVKEESAHELLKQHLVFYFYPCLANHRRM